MPTDTPDRLLLLVGALFLLRDRYFCSLSSASHQNNTGAHSSGSATHCLPLLAEHRATIPVPELRYAHSRTHARTHFSHFHPRHALASPTPRSFRSHLSARPGTRSGLVWFLVPPVLLLLCSIHNFLLAQVTAIVIDSLAHHHSTAVAAQHHFPSATVLLAAVVA